MKSLEEVIQNKFLVLKGVNRYYSFSERLEQEEVTGRPIYVIDNMKIDNIVEFIKLITPLLSYIISILKHEQEYMDKQLILKLEFPISEGGIKIEGAFKVNDDNVLKTIRTYIEDFEEEGYYMKFTKRFNAYILIKDIEEDSDDEDDEMPIMKNININKTFKLDECVICMEYIPNVLFCECGHICLCEKCIEIKQFDRCPICKTDITILRIIE